MINGVSRRKLVRLPCTLQFYTGVTSYGHTRNLSLSRAFVECSGCRAPGEPAPKTGDMAIFSFRMVGMMGGGEVLRIPCRIMHVAGTACEIELLPSSLASSHKAMLIGMLKSEVG